MGHSGKYGVIKTEFGNIPEDEPVFLFRAQDKYTADILIKYALQRYSDGDRKAYDQIMLAVDKVRAWPTNKKPD